MYHHQLSLHTFPSALCTPWPKKLPNLPVKIETRNYVFPGPSVKHSGARKVVLTVSGRRVSFFVPPFLSLFPPFPPPSLLFFFLPLYIHVFLHPYPPFSFFLLLYTTSLSLPPIMPQITLHLYYATTGQTKCPNTHRTSKKKANRTDRISLSL